MGAWNLKNCEILGGVGEKIYLCITLSCTRQIESKLSLRSLAKCLHKIGCGSAIEASFIALALHNLCIPNSVERLKGEDYGDNDIKQNTSASLADVSSG